MYIYKIVDRKLQSFLKRSLEGYVSIILDEENIIKEDANDKTYLSMKINVIFIFIILL